MHKVYSFPNRLKFLRSVVPYCAAILFQLILVTVCYAQYTTAKGNDANTPLHLLQPDYVTPYGPTKPANIKAVLDRVYKYLDATTPYTLQDKNTENTVALNKADSNSVFTPGDFRLISYEWGVAYTGMLEAGAATGDKRYTDYAVKRVGFIGDVVAHYKDLLKTNPGMNSPVASVLHPKALDDAGSITASFIKTVLADPALKAKMRPIIDNDINYIMTKEYRLKDGTLARNRPLPNTLWLDDLYMSLPALMQAGVLTGDKKYFDEALKQYGLFSKRMFNHEKGLYMHGWVQGMYPHPQFHWARANGWGLLTKVEILDVLPANYPGRAYILSMLREHAAGLARLQDKTGFWHQLLDKNDSYLETSATAIYAYCIARAVDKGWLDAKAYGPMAILAWNAVSTKVNAQGQVEGTCVGTGMAFDPAFYYYRPVNVFAAHGYGPVLMAGAEVYRMVQKFNFEINDSAVMFKGK